MKHLNYGKIVLIGAGHVGSAILDSSASHESGWMRLW